MRNISDKLRKDRIRQLKILIGNYEKTLKNSKDEKTRSNLLLLIQKAQNEIRNIK